MLGRAHPVKQQPGSICPLETRTLQGKVIRAALRATPKSMRLRNPIRDIHFALLDVLGRAYGFKFITPTLETIIDWVSYKNGTSVGLVYKVFQESSSIVRGSYGK